MIDESRLKNWINQSLATLDQSILLIQKSQNSNVVNEQLRESIRKITMAQGFLETLLKAIDETPN